MKKACLFLLAALLLCGLFACKPVIPTEENEASTAPSEPAATESEHTAVLTQTEGPVFSEERARLFSVREDRNTGWVYNGPYDKWGHHEHYHLLIYEDGTAYLFTPNEVFTLTENDDAFLLTVRLFRTENDEEPALTLSAGEMRIHTDGTAVLFEVLSDPFGILAFDALNNMVLKKENDGPGDTRSIVNWIYVPLEPDTEWFSYFDMGECGFAHLKMTINEDGGMTGTMRFPDGAERSCILVGNNDSYALVDEDGELLFFGERSKMYEQFDAYRYELVQFGLDVICDPLEMCANDTVSIWRDDDDSEEDKLLRYMLGKNLDSVILSLIRNGWTDQTPEIEGLDPCLEGFFAWLTKDGQTLVIHYELDFSTPYAVSEAYADAFVLYGADGAVLKWGGAKPIDHTIADGYRLEKDAYFYQLTGGTGAMITGEDEDAYFLDDGRIAIETMPHEGGDGDEDFQIVKVIP